MKFTLSWLKDRLDSTASVDAVVETLIDLGLEFDGILIRSDRCDSWRASM